MAEESETPPTPEEQIEGLRAQCEKSAEARVARQEKKSLYERLGKEEGIHAITTELIRLHHENDDIKHIFKGMDDEVAAKKVAEFMISGIGGPKVYDGPELKVSHADMGLTTADFLAAGGDMMQAMKNLEYGEEETEEVVCILVSLMDQVVFEKSAKIGKKEQEEAGGWE